MTKPVGVLRALAALFVIVAAIGAGGCSSCGSETKAPEKKAAELPRIEPMEGFTYYVGGPTIAYDQYGNQRIAGFNGEVLSPPSEGVVVALHDLGEGKVEYYSYLNGKLLTKTVARRDADGLLWNLKRENFENGARVREEIYEYDDDAAVVRASIRRFSATDGELIDEGTVETPYAPGNRYVEDADEDDEGSGDDGSDGEGTEIPLHVE